MKMVVNGYASAGTIELGGYDYHAGDRATGEMRDLEAGQCIGACLEYAARMGQPLMIYVFTDGSVVSSGMIDNSVGGRGKGVWMADNQAPPPRSSWFTTRRPADCHQQSDRQLHQRRQRQYDLEPGCECRQPAGRDRGAQLYGAA